MHPYDKLMTTRQTRIMDQKIDQTGSLSAKLFLHSDYVVTNHDNPVNNLFSAAYQLSYRQEAWLPHKSYDIHRID